MRQPRLLAPPHHPFAYYHCVSRVVDQQFKFGPREKDCFVSIMKEYTRFCGVGVQAYCIMGNHFHLLIRVPKPPHDLSGYEWLLERLEGLTVTYPVAKNARQKILKHLKEGAEDLVEKIVDQFKAMMWDLSQFMKLVKQRFTQKFNTSHERKGTLWESRFHSTLIEGAGAALASVAAYIELNPVRAGIVADPADYEWSSYGKACRGDTVAMEGIRNVVAGAQGVAEGSLSLEEGMTAYRGVLIGKSAEDATAWKGSVCPDTDPALTKEDRGVPRNAANETPMGEARKVTLGPTREEVLARVLGNETVSLAEYVRIRVRYFNDGGALGSREYVGKIFQELRDRFGPNRELMGSPVQGLDGPAGFFSLRSLKKRLFG